jgi:uncharacterized membrane protein
VRSVAIAALVVAACWTDPPPIGVFTESVCPTTDPPTFANFGQPFFTSYCIACHSQSKTGDDRQGAPVTIDFDTRSLVRENTSRIDKQAAFGPRAMNTLMPLDGNPAPSDPERVRLGEYIACEVAQ